MKPAKSILSIFVLGILLMPNIGQTQAKSIRDQARLAVPKRTFVATVSKVDYTGLKLWIFLDAQSAQLELHLGQREIDDIRARKIGRGHKVAVMQEGSEFYALSVFPENQHQTYLPFVATSLAAPVWNSLQIVGANLVGSFNVVPGAARYQLWKRLTTDDPSAATLVDDSVATNFTLPYNQSGNTNLQLLNPGFESGDMTGWSHASTPAPGQASFAISTAQKHTDNYAAHIIVGGPGGTSSLLADKLAVQENTTVALSFWKYLVDSSVVGANARLVWYDANDNWLGENVVNSDTGSLGTWVKLQGTATAPSGARFVEIGIYTLGSTIDVQEAYIDDVALIGQSTIQANFLFALKAIDANNNASAFGTWLQPPVSAQAMGDPSVAHTQINYAAAGYISSALTPGTGVAQTPNGFTDTGWKVPLKSAADPTIETWTFVSASSFKIVGFDATLRYKKGTRIKWTQTTVKYGVVTSSSFAAGDTTINIAVNTNYTIANSAITDNFYSYDACPPGYPTVFDLTPTITSGTGALTTVSCAAKYRAIGNTVFYTGVITLTNNGTGATDLRIPLPTNLAGSGAAFAGVYVDGSAVNNMGYVQLGILGNTSLDMRDYASNYPGISGHTYSFSIMYDF